MALELPDWLTDAFNLIGLPWPGIDEDQLHDWARSVRQFASDICDTSSQTSQTMQDLAGSSQSSVIGGVARQYESHHRLLTELHGPMDDFATALDYAADAVVAQKWIVIGAATTLAAEFTATQIGALFTLGADEAALPAEVISTQQIVKFALKELEAVLIGRLINYGATELGDHVSHSVVTLANDAWGMHMETQGITIAYEKVSAAARQLNGHADDAERLGSRASAENAGRPLTDHSGGGGWAEVVNALKQGLLTIAEDLFKTLPATIAKVIRDIAGVLERFAARLRGADEEGNVAAPGNTDPRAGLSAREKNSEINNALTKVNPKFNPSDPAYSRNCTSVVQANELQRRGIDVQAGPLEPHLKGGRGLDAIENAWGAKFKPGTKSDIEEAFKEPGSRGVVSILWNGRGRGGHVFNVENIDGKVRFVDGQPNPPVTDASSYFDRGHSTQYVRLDNLPTPPADSTKPYLEPGAGA